MIKKIFFDIFLSNINLQISKNNESKILGYYYFKFIENPKVLNRQIKKLDKDGIPLNASYVDVEDKNKLYYYPISIGQYGLAVYHSYLDNKSDEKRDYFLRIAEWFYNNRIEDEKLGVYWETDTPKPEYHIYKPWMSAFSQSRGLSILLRAWQITGDDKYLDSCKKALIPFTYDILDGGVTANLKVEKPFYY